MKKILKYSILFCMSGVIYITCELISRHFSHWTMFIVAGLAFIPIGLLNKWFSWRMSLLLQMFIGAVIITVLEFCSGCIINLWLGWNVWDYSNLPFNLLGQICPQFFGVWMIASLAIILLDDWMRYWFFHEERPHYKF